MRYALLALVMVVLLLTSACSYITDFVVINATDLPIEIVYKIKKPPYGPPEINITPVITSTSQLKASDKSIWRKLEPDKYQIDQRSRVINVRLQSREVLFLTSAFHYFGPDDSNDVNQFSIEELRITGSVGELKSSWKQLLKVFTKRSRDLYTLTYE